MKFARAGERSVSKTEGNRIPVERPDFKSGEMRQACLVGSTPTPFRQSRIALFACLRHVISALLNTSISSNLIGPVKALRLSGRLRVM